MIHHDFALQYAGEGKALIPQCLQKHLFHIHDGLCQRGPPHFQPELVWCGNGDGSILWQIYELYCRGREIVLRPHDDGELNNGQFSADFNQGGHAGCVITFSSEGFQQRYLVPLKTTAKLEKTQRRRLSEPNRVREIFQSREYLSVFNTLEFNQVLNSNILCENQKGERWRDHSESY